MRTLIDELLSVNELENYEWEFESGSAKRRPPNYIQMETYYPFGSVQDVKSLIGGGVNQNWITNTCVVRVSRSLNYAGDPIPGNFKGLLTVKGGDGKRYALRVREFKKYLISKYGQPDVTHTNTSLSANIPNSFIGKQGIIMFEVSGWSDATGHVTLWDGFDCVNNENYWSRAQKVFLWVSN